MSRIAIVASREHLRATLVELAASGMVEIDTRPLAEPFAVPWIARTPERSGLGAEPVTPRVTARPRRLDELEQAGRQDLVAGELELGRMADQAITHRGASILVGWTPQATVAELVARLAPLWTAVHQLPHPPRAEAPTLLLGPPVGRSVRPLVDAYGTVPYRDVDPALFAGFSYIFMFGVMFGDAGHGLILAALGLYLRRTGRASLASARRVWAVIVGAGLAATVGGLLYGEMFGPTGLVSVLWLRPMEQPFTLLAAGVIAGAVLLGSSYVIGMANRWREGGPLRLLYASSGIAGASLYLGAAATVTAIVAGVGALLVPAAAILILGLVLLFAGSMFGSGGGPTGVMEALVEVVDTVIRTAANSLSFARLAAFGLTHATIGSVVWAATTVLWASGGLGLPAAFLVFAAGNALAFALEALVAGLQALRLEYYELFSRIFTGEGRVFAPWRLTVIDEEEL